MSGFLDTSIIVRYLTDDPPELAEKAALVIDSEEQLHITDVVLVETAYVLTAVYHIPRRVVVDHLITFLQKENIILSVGRFTKAINTKKQEFLVDVFKKIYDRGLSNWRFVLVGSVLPKDNDFVGTLKRRAEGYPIDVLPNVSFKKLREFYKKAKIYWHAAGFGEDLDKHPERAEHFGISTVEAMGAGVVPVVINAGAQPEIVANGISGFLFKTEDELIAKTILLTQNEKLREKISREATKRVKLFSRKEFCKKVNSLLT